MYWNFEYSLYIIAKLFMWFLPIITIILIVQVSLLKKLIKILKDKEER